MPALTGLRAFAALNLVFFHFANPKDFGWFAPVVDNGYTSVSFLCCCPDSFLAYNYSDRAARGEMAVGKFWMARFSRLYPVYIFSLVVSLGMLATEFQVHTRPMSMGGVSLDPAPLCRAGARPSPPSGTPRHGRCPPRHFSI